MYKYLGMFLLKVCTDFLRKGVVTREGGLSNFPQVDVRVSISTKNL